MYVRVLKLWEYLIIILSISVMGWATIELILMFFKHITFYWEQGCESERTS